MRRSYMVAKQYLNWRRFRRWHLLGGVALFAMLLAACVASAPGGQGSAPAANGATTIKLMCWEGTIGTKDLVTNDLIPSSEKANPTIKIDYEVLPWDQYW